MCKSPKSFTSYFISILPLTPCPLQELILCCVVRCTVCHASCGFLKLLAYGGNFHGFKRMISLASVDVRFHFMD